MNAAPAQDRTALSLATVLAACASVYLFFADPYARGTLLPPCPLHSLTGLYCPGCGSTRAFHELLHGHLAAALHCNPFTVLTVPPLLLILFLPPLNARLRPTWRWAAAYAFAALVFAILRNLPHSGLPGVFFTS